MAQFYTGRIIKLSHLQTATQKKKKESYFNTTSTFESLKKLADKLCVYHVKMSFIKKVPITQIFTVSVMHYEKKIKFVFIRKV